MPSKLALGTVQFGMRYGIANQSGQVSLEEGERILECARRAGVDTIDTAIAYGDSEQRLGAIGVAGWRVITKLPAVPAGIPDIGGWVRQCVSGSLERLKLTRLAGLLLHRSADLLEHGDRLFSALRELKERGVVEKIGVSIYAPEELAPLTERHELDLVQAPFNVLDRRLQASGWLARLKAAGAEVHTRSAFLQGLLLMEPGRRPASFDRWSHLWGRWSSWLTEHGHTALEASLAFVLATPGIDRVVVGVDSATQLREILDAGTTVLTDMPNDMTSTDLDLISPVAWRTS